MLHTPYLSAGGSTHSPSAEMVSGLTRTSLAHLLTQSCKRCLLHVYYVLRPVLRLEYLADPTDMVPTVMGLTLKQGRWTVGGSRVFPARISRELWGCSDPALRGVQGGPPHHVQLKALSEEQSWFGAGAGSQARPARGTLMRECTRQAEPSGMVRSVPYPQHREATPCVGEPGSMWAVSGPLSLCFRGWTGCSPAGARPATVSSCGVQSFCQEASLIHIFHIDLMF